MPNPNPAPEFQVNTSGGYTCSNSEAQMCLHVRRHAPAGSQIYYPASVYYPRDAAQRDNDQFRYSLGGTDKDQFRIAAASGTLYTNEAHAYNSPGSDGYFEVTIIATDPSGKTGQVTAAIRPSSSANAPVVVGPSYIEYPENGTWPLASYTATIKAHIDANTNYSYIGWLVSVNPGGGDGDFFRIDDDGNLTFTQPPDYENPADYPYIEGEKGDNRYSFSLHVYETNPPQPRPQNWRPSTTFFSVTVVVTDETVEALEIDGPSAVRYAENGEEPVGTYSLLRAQASVDDWVLSGADADQFDIDGTTGELTFKRSPDYENPTDVAEENTYRVTITAYAGTESKTEFVFVRVTDVNEPPEFDEGDAATRSVEPDADVNDYVGDAIEATDPDGDGLSYTLEATPAPPFQIDPWTGQISVSGAIDSNRASYTMTVFVTDGLDDEGNTDTTADDRITVTVAVAGGGSSNNVPVFPTDAVTFSIDENLTTVQNVGTPVTATDDDTDDTLTYTLGGTDVASFDFDATTRQIKTKSTVTYDYEAKSSYSVTVTADDDNGGTATKDVTITLTNLDEDGTVTLSTNQPTARAQVTATLDDPDGVTGTTAWQWSRSSTPQGTYDDISGVTSATYEPVDGDVNYYLRATATYTDGFPANKTAKAETTGTVQIGTNRPPTFDDRPDTIREVAEKTAADQPVGSPVAATDLDGDDLTYSLTGQDAGLFTIETGTGQVKVKSGTALDYEGTRNSYTVIVKVTDGKTAAGVTEQPATTDDTIIVTINVTNVEEAGTVTLSMTYPSARAELTATLTDPDGGVTGETWQWTRSDAQDGTYDDINGETLANYTPDDGDVSKFLKAKVSYTDAEASGKNAEAVSDNAVGSGENRAPTFAAGAVTRTVDENSGADVDVGSPVTATDLDTGNTVTHSLEGTDKDDFKIVSDSGQIQTKSGVTYDYETKPSYSVTVEADDGNSGTATKDVTISLTNVEEAGTVRLSPTQPAARQSVTATLTDPDEVSGTPTWQWQRSSDGNSGWTNVGTNSSSYTPPDADLTYYLQATATYTDGQGSGKTATAKTVGAVQAGTNRAPTFDDGPTTSRGVAEDAAATDNVGAVVAATDLDSDDLTYSLTSTDASSFTVDNTGQIKVGATTTLDYESAKNTYTVVVQVTDSKDPAGGTETNPTIDDNITVTINVTDEEEAGTVSLSTTHPAARAQLTATLTDPDGGVTGESWQWSKSDSQSVNYDDISGATSATYTPGDGDLNKFLKATATYTDRRGAGKTAEAVTDNAVGTGTKRPPEFPGTTTTREFPEDLGPGQPIGIPVGATDADINDVLKYTLKGTDAASFEIVPTDGQIKTKDGVTYNHEAKDSYVVTVKVDDQKGDIDTITVTINVTDVNEKPAFTATLPVTFSIAENTSANTNIGTAGATDPDDGDTLFYSLDSDSAAIFNIDSSNGQLRTKAALDKETKATYTVTVLVRDNRGVDGNPDIANDATIPVTITVTDVNEPPAFPASETRVRNVLETTPANQNIGNPVAAVDPDVDASLIYTLLGSTDAGSFGFDPLTGQLKTKVTLDKEAKATYTVTVSVHDGHPDNTVDDTITVTINVTDSNEPPVLSGSAAVSYPENGSGPVYTYTAIDPEGATIDWSLKGTDAAEFTIDGGMLAFVESPDYEDPSNTDNEYVVTVVATDKHNPVELAVTVTITDINDPPTFDSATVNRVVAESREPGEPVSTAVSAEDVDAGDTLTYSLGGEDSAYFGINSSTGQITVGAGTTLDFETRTRYVVTVTATDSSYTSATITVSIEVSNADEDGTVTLSQAQPQAGTPLVATLDDPDGDFVSSTNWKWEISTDKSSWGVITGATTASYTPVAGDVDKFLRVTASYTDGHGSNKTAHAAPADPVRPAPPTNAAPAFSSQSLGRGVAENTAAGEVVGTAVTATDTDTDDELTYTLGGVDAQSFTIVGDTGQIQTKAALDYEAKSTYTVTVTATDPSRESDTVTVTITVTDVNEPPLAPGIPAMIQNSQTSLTMAWTAPSSTGRPAVTDYDYRYKKNSETNWTEVADTAITLTTVEITGLDATMYYDVQARATNAEGTGDWSDSGIGITRTLPNTEPEFSGPTTTRDVAENTEQRQNIGDPVEADDTDRDDLTYILEGFDASSFMIDEDTGQLKTSMPLDHEQKDSYSVMVKAVDGRGGSDSISVNINVLDVNEPPKFTGNLGAHSVPENAGSGVDIGAPVAATDQEDDPLTYSLDAAGAQVFAIDSSTGQLQTKAALDYETDRVHLVTVYVSDRKNAGGNADPAADDDISVTITVTNVNEPPVFTGATLGRSVDENSVIGTDVGAAIAATDPEEDTLTYSLGGTDKDSFSLDTSSGQLKTRTDLDYESPKKSYTVTVSVTDGKNADGNSDTTTDATTTVTIAVADVDEPPAVTIRSTVRYAENGADPVDTYTATDPEDRTITWDISGTDVDDFKIRKVNNEGVLEFRTPPNFEAPADADGNNVYLVTVEVSDGTNTDRLDVAVTVYGVNEEPAFPAETGSRSVDENTTAGVNISDAVAATDPERHTLIYKLAGTDAASFAIDTSTGQLKTKAPLDYETKDRYEVTVQVRDSLDQDDRVNAVTDDTIDITININNVEEAGWIVMSSRQPQIDTAFTATIEDPDGSVTGATWVWERSTNKSSWTTITGANTASYTPVAADSGNYLQATASYTDGHDSGKTAVGISDNPVRVHPDPENNVAPTFDSPTATRNIDEGAAAGQNIGAPVAATDTDYDLALLTYSLTGTDAESFNISRATGQLLTKAPLDHETKDSYAVTVKVVDPSLDSATITVTINVNDVDEPPVLTGPDVVDYPENGTDAVARYTAEDPEGDTITWLLEGDDKDLFEISGGELTFKSSPDHDIAGDDDGNNIYEVTVKVTARSISVTLPVEITVSNVNEAPEFSETGPLSRTVAENTAADENIGDPVAATDPDSGDTLTYTLGGDDAGSFAIEETTGQLKTKAELDHETKGSYTVEVTATDQSDLFDTITVTITVSSVNEPPEFTDGATAARSVAENTPADQDIGAAVAATDPETDTIAYTLGGDDAASFTIDESDGQLKTFDPLDHETKASYSVTVSVSDGKDIDDNNDTVIDNTIDVTITVTDQDEDGTVILSSLQPQVDTALTATLVEPDDATNVSWTWHSSSNWSSGWTAISGATSDSYTPVTGDVGNYLRATATFTNSANAQVSVHGISAYPVRAAPASNVAPDFAAPNATRSIAEDAPLGSAVGDPVTATDTNAADVLTYSLSGTDAESFSIGMASGQLRTKVTLDHDTKASYSVVVKAADPSGLSDTITVTITVTDENEPPVISGKTSVYYAEGRTDAVATYTATDPEGVTIDDWSLDGDDKDLFEISTAGVLTFKSSPDHDVPGDKDGDNVYLVTVQASDGTNTVSLDVTVTVRDAADPPPAPDAPTVTAAATDGHTALSVSWQAPAVTGASPITDYEVEYGKQGTEDWSSDNVTITGVTAAITNVLPDTDYEVRVRAENADGWGKWSEPGTGRTEVTPLDQQIDLTVSYHAAGYTVDEGATRAVSVRLSAAADRALQVPITVAPTTAQPGDYQVTGLTSGALSFVPGDSSKSFTFEALDDTDTSDETVTMGFGQPLPDKVTAGDRTTSAVTIADDDTATPRRRNRGGRGGGGGGSGGGSYGSSSSTNKAPVFTEGDSASRSVAENTAAGVNIGKPVRATDADNDTLRYTVGGDDGSAFAVDSTTGQLRTKSALDFERKSSYRVTMGVFDPKGGSDTITVTITVTDVTDVPLASGSTQMIGVVDSEQDTTVSTLDGSVAVTFPSGSRSGDYQARLDYGLNNCNPDFSSEELWFCLTVDIFDNEGNLEQGVVLSRPATIKIRRNGDERGGVDAVLGLHAQGGVSVYTRGRTGGEWTESAFTLESDGVGGIVITITGVSSFGLYAGTTDSSVPVQVSHQVATVPVPTQNTGGQGSSPEPTPTPTPTPTPQPGSSSEQSTTPEPTSTPEPVITPGTNPTPEPTLGHQVSAPFGPLGGPAATPPPPPTPAGIAKGLGNLASVPPLDGDSVPTAEPEVKEASFDSEDGESGGMPSWYIAIIMLGVAASIAGGGTYFVKRRTRVSSPVTVRRSREFNKWWSG